MRTQLTAAKKAAAELIGAVVEVMCLIEAHFDKVLQKHPPLVHQSVDTRD